MATASVITTEGEDVSAGFLGAYQALGWCKSTASALPCSRPGRLANLLTYDGTFSGVKVSGEGVTAAAQTPWRSGLQ
jgi:hypothetical protein